MKHEYQSLAKKALQGKEFMEKYNIGVDKFLQQDARYGNIGYDLEREREMLDQRTKKE